MPLPNSDDFDADYSGIKTDYSEAVDLTTDLPAAASNNARASTAGLTRTAKRVYVIWSNNGTTGTISEFDSVIGNASINYPTISKVGTGLWRFTFPATCVDMLGNTAFWNFKYAAGDAFTSAAPCKVQTQISAPNVVEVYLFDLGAPGLDDLSGIDLLLEIR